MSTPQGVGGAGVDSLVAGAGRADALAALGRAFARREGDEGLRAARILFLGILNLGFTEIITSPGTPLTGAELGQLRAAAVRYLAGEPPGRILGHRAFWGMNFQLGPDTLEPRPDTETLVETALRRLTGAGAACAGAGRDAPLRILDLGCGTGCILISLLGELTGAFGVGVDLAPGAAGIARANADANGVGGRSAFLAGDWARAIGGEAGQGGLFDLLVCNPPYIEDWTLAGLSDGVRLYDPVLALDGGRDGLAPYRILAPEVMRLLRPGGVAAFEVGIGQAATVAGLMRASGLGDVQVTEDLAGVMRVVSGQRREVSGHKF